MNKVFSALTSLAAGILFYAGFLFFKYNYPIIEELPTVNGLAALMLVGMMVLSVFCMMTHNEILFRNQGIGVFLLIAALVLVWVFLQSAVLDYFQPFSLYDDVIYLTLVGFVLLIIRFVVDGIRSLAGQEVCLASIGVAVLALLFVSVFAGWAMLQGDFEYENIAGDPMHLFVGGDRGYASYRIPGLLVIPAGSDLGDGSTAKMDIVLAFAEARRNGSLDDGDIDLVMRRSVNGGDDWTGQEVVRAWAPGEGKIGNPTPVFDAETGVLHLFHIAGAGRPYTVWVMESLDGGKTFGHPQEISGGIVGPGHGVQVTSGPYAGRLVVPFHVEGSSSTLYSDDKGLSWLPGNPVGEGNESEVAMMPDGSLLMVVRTNHPVAKPHDELYQLFSVSEDWGVNWRAAEPHETLKTPICMSSLVVDGDRAYHSGPDSFYSRARMTVSSGSASELDFADQTLIYSGPAGYSDMGVLSDGGVLLLLENGAVEYDERITLVRVDN